MPQAPSARSQRQNTQSKKSSPAPAVQENRRSLRIFQKSIPRSLGHAFDGGQLPTKDFNIGISFLSIAAGAASSSNRSYELLDSEPVDSVGAETLIDKDCTVEENIVRCTYRVCRLNRDQSSQHYARRHKDIAYHRKIGGAYYAFKRVGKEGDEERPYRCLCGLFYHNVRSLGDHMTNKKCWILNHQGARNDDAYNDHGEYPIDWRQSYDQIVFDLDTFQNEFIFLQSRISNLEESVKNIHKMLDALYY